MLSNIIFFKLEIWNSSDGNRLPISALKVLESNLLFLGRGAFLAGVNLFWRFFIVFEILEPL